MSGWNFWGFVYVSEVENYYSSFPRSNIRAKVAAKGGKICNQTTMKKISGDGIADETNGFKMDFVEKAERQHRSATLDMGAVL